MSCKMLQGGHKLAHKTRGTADGFLEIKDMKKEEGCRGVEQDVG